MKVCHISSAHSRSDVRIYVKEICSLRKYGYDVCYLVADGLGDDNDKSVIDVGKPAGRITRLFKTRRKLLTKALKLNANVYHLHDPELIYLGRKLKTKGKMVVYDVHEDLPRQILTKPYLKKLFPGFLAHIVQLWENKNSKRFDCIIAATPEIKSRFLHFNSKTETVMNYPVLKEIKYNPNKEFKRKSEVLYIGSITEVRGIEELVVACSQLPVNLTIAGSFHDEYYKKRIMNIPGWERVNYLGFVDRDTINTLLTKSHIGITVLYPAINYLTSYPVKMFEYMAAGVPVIASDFDLWKSIIIQNNCGICIKPKNIGEMKKAIQYLSENPDISVEMGRNGREAVLKKYNWCNEEKKLISIYKNMIND